MSLPTHSSHETNPRDRGYALGRAHSNAIRNTVKVYRRLFSEAAGLGKADIELLGSEFGECVTRSWPDLVEEIDAIAAGSQQSGTELLAINARTELLASGAAPECSLIGVVSSGQVKPICLLAQNWDWHPDLRESRLIWLVIDRSGRWFVTMTEAGILAKIGMNSSGLGCGLNFLKTTADGDGRGLPIHILLRLFLDRCNTPADALALALSSEVASSSCITFGYADSAGAVVFSAELSPHGARMFCPDERGYLVHTNHFLAGAPAGQDLVVREWPGTLIRQWHLEHRLKQLSRPARSADVEELLSSHFGTPEAVCRHHDRSEPWVDQCETLVSVIMDLKSPSMLVTDGPPCETSYELVSLPHREGSPRAMAAWRT